MNCNLDEDINFCQFYDKNKKICIEIKKNVVTLKIHIKQKLRVLKVKKESGLKNIINNFLLSK